MPTKDTYNTHIACGSTAAYLISINAINKTLSSKIYGHLDFIQHNFIKYNKYYNLLGNINPIINESKY